MRCLNTPSGPVMCIPGWKSGEGTRVELWGSVTKLLKCCSFSFKETYLIYLFLCTCATDLCLCGTKENELGEICWNKAKNELVSPFHVSLSRTATHMQAPDNAAWFCPAWFLYRVLCWEDAFPVIITLQCSKSLPFSYATYWETFFRVRITQIQHFLFQNRMPVFPEVKCNPKSWCVTSPLPWYAAGWRTSERAVSKKRKYGNEHVIGGTW